MPRPSKTQVLLVWMNGERVGQWVAPASDPQEFSYAEDWIAATHARPISLSMPLGPAGTSYRGAVVERFFENLLPDNRAIRERLRQRFSARSRGAFDLLAKIGRDCIGAIQLTTEGEAPPEVRRIEGRPLDANAVALLLRRTLTGPGLGREHLDDEDFRISLAGVHVDENRHYVWNSIQRRHWPSTARLCGMATQIDRVIEELVAMTPQVIAIVESSLPTGFPDAVAGPVLDGLRSAAKRLSP